PDIALLPKVILLGCFVVLLAHVQAGSSVIEQCFRDNDYKHLLEDVKQGLIRTGPPKNFVIVGAGISGLIAAKLLEDAGHNVQILEASDRLRGHILTYRNESRGWHAELGAMRIPATHELVLHYVQHYGLKLSEFIHADESTWYFTNGKLNRVHDVDKNPDLLGYTVKDYERGKSAKQLYSEAIRKVIDEIEKDQSQCQRVLKKYDTYSVKVMLAVGTNLSRHAIQMIGDVLNAQSLFYTTFSENLRRENDINDDVKFYKIDGGTDWLPQAVRKYLRSTTVLLNSRVLEINQTSEGVQVAYRDKTDNSVKTTSGDYLLFTGTAKATLIVRFNPPLPLRKRVALRNIHYDSSTKIFLVFKEQFWEKEVIHRGKSITDHPSRLIYYMNEAGGVVLASYTCSDESLFFLGMSNEDCQELALSDLAAIHGEGIRDLYEGGVVKKWSLDEYSLGAYVLFTPFQLTDYYQDLFKPFERVYFAGEHTALPHAWIETSIKSTVRAASQMNNKSAEDVSHIKTEF
ncbi:OXLA oxidase, partial [Atractosteus spatula]|nr:OXLA oxidase [Atractosteus spatula]